MKEIVVDVDMSTPCRLPFKGAVAVSKHKKRSVKLKKNPKGFHLDENPIVTLKLQSYSHLSTGEIYEQAEKCKHSFGEPLSAKVLDCFEDNPELWPPNWKGLNCRGGTIYIFFWGDIFCDSKGDRYVRCGSWDDDKGKVVSGWLSFDSDVYADNLAAFAFLRN